MDGINKKYNLEIEVLTPLSIGAGAEKDWVRGVDFVVDNGKLYKLNLKKIVANGFDITELTDCFAKKNENKLKAILAGKLDVVSDFSMPFPAESDNDVKAFVKNQLSGDPVLAGSSLKGALRSVLLYAFASKQEINDAVDKGRKLRKPFESFVFGSPTNGDEFMRFIKISDAEFNKTELVNTKIFNLQGGGNNWQGGWKHQMTKDGNTFTNGTFSSTGFNTLYESLVPQQKGYASLMLSEKLYDNFAKHAQPHIKSAMKSPIMHNDISTLFAIINIHTQNYLLKEKVFFEKYHTDRTDEIVASIDALLNQIPSDGSCCILKMSAGSGFHSITGDWLFDDYAQTGFWELGRNAGKKKYKSRKIAEWNETLSLMGFIKLRQMSEAEVEDIETRRQQIAQQKEELRLAKMAEEKKAKEAEEKAKQQQREKEEKYAQLLANAEQLASEKRYREALDLCNEAKALLPSKDSLDKFIAELEEKLRAEEREKLILANKQHDLEERKLANAVPLAEKIANAQKLPTLYGNVKQWMKQNGRESLSDNEICDLRNQIEKIVLAMKPRDKKGMKNLGKDLENMVGQDTATKWFNEIVYQ